MEYTQKWDSKEGFQEGGVLTFYAFANYFVDFSENTLEDIKGSVAVLIDEGEYTMWVLLPRIPEEFQEEFSLLVSKNNINTRRRDWRVGRRIMGMLDLNSLKSSWEVFKKVWEEEGISPSPIRTDSEANFLQVCAYADLPDGLYYFAGKIE